MKKVCNILLIVFFGFLISTAFGQRLKGKVMSFKESYYSIKYEFGKMQKGPKLNDSGFLEQYVSLDPKGNISEWVEYNFDGTIYCKYNGNKDYEDNNIESVSARFDPDIIFDRKPFIIESVKYGWGESFKMTYRNDSKGLPVEETISDFRGRVLYTIKITRDEKGNPLEANYSDGAVDQFKYDDKGNRTEWVYRASDSNIILTDYKYDEYGNITETKINNYFKSTYTFHYDYFTFKYHFDSHGNWTERIDYDNDKPQRIVMRTFEYAE